MPRYSIIAILMTLVAIAVIFKTAYIMTAKRQYWTDVAARLKVDSVQVKPTRGNIYSSDGQLMASSLPEFKMFMDFKALHEAGNDSLWEVKLDSVAAGLNQIFPNRSKADFIAKLEEGRQKQSRHWAIWERRVPYSIYKEVMQLPVFNLSKYKSGFHAEEFNARRRPFTTLAQRTIGDMFGAKDTARCGLELSYDSILRGKNGIIHRRKVLNKYLSITDIPPEDGMDIVTTIDVGIQDLAERAVVDELKLINGNVGVAIVMEVATGDIKAIVNMEKCLDSNGEVFYAEAKNHAVSDLLEPGSVFKTASIMVALDDGVCDTNFVVETGGGVWNMYGRDMKDHNWRRGGYGTMRLPKSLEVSSNIGVSRIIDRFYHNNPEKYVQGLYDLGINCDLGLPIPGYSPAKIRMPKKDSRGKQYLNWSKTALPWMSIGYETQVPPISTLTFYNAIANNGKMMKPRFVKEVLKDGEVYMEFPPQVVEGHGQIAKPSTIATIQTILEHVVSQGLGKKAGSPSFKVAGKTGTAQIWSASGKTSAYLLSFAGYFPADKPRYSCIVCIQKDGTGSGGGMSGLVFHHISEGIMAQSLKLDATDARDTSSILIPQVKDGNLLAADYVLNHLGFNVSNGWSGMHAFGKPIWGVVNSDKRRTLSLVKKTQLQGSGVPDVKGMGARDAVYLMESKGIKVIINGRGKVVEQSIPAGNTIKKGQTCTLKLA